MFQHPSSFAFTQLVLFHCALLTSQDAPRPSGMEPTEGKGLEWAEALFLTCIYPVHHVPGVEKGKSSL